MKSNNTVTRFRLFFLAACVVLIGLAGCERGPVGIFASIEREVEIAEGNLLKNVLINGMVEIVVDTEMTYFAAVGGYVRYRRASASEKDWSTIGNPSGYGSHSRPTSIVKTDDGTTENIYVSFVEGERKRSGLFRLDPDTRNYVQAGQFGSDRQLSALFALGNELFASVQIRDDKGDATHQLWYLGSGATAELDPTDAGALATSIDAQSRRFISGATDGTNYWFITANTLFHSTDAFAALSEVGKPPNVEKSLGGITVFNGDVYLSSRSGSNVTGGSTGNISRADVLAGGTLDWTISITENDRAFTDFGTATLGTTLLVGTYRTVDQRGGVISPGGFMQLDGDLNNIRRPPGNSYVTAQLSKGSVMRLFVPTAPNTVFALTAGYGLWRGDYDSDGNDATWVWE